ncbi:MAG: hypothetical protein HKN63_00110 [Rhodobacteraceae bacterium]|nr:hypothetical protein [Paracoccaceae bacterium]
MTALTEFERLEAPGLWHPSPDAQRQDVVLSMGDASLIIFDNKEMALAHWSLAALERQNPGQRPAIYAPGPDAIERLEIADDTMVRAIEKVRRAVARRSPHPGRLRFRLGLAIGAAAAVLAVFWVPGALIGYTASLLPPAKREAIGNDLLERVQRVSGQPCTSPGGMEAISLLKDRLGEAGPRQIAVLRGGVPSSAHLPGGIVLLNRSVVEDHESAEVAAGYVLTETERAASGDTLIPLLKSAGLWSTLRLMTTGNISESALDTYTEELLSGDPAPPNTMALLKRFKASRVPSSPYAYAIDISGETTVGLIEADPVPASLAAPILKDGHWVALQGICSE